MPTLPKELRRTLENVVADARRIAEAGAEQALKQLAVHHSESWPAMTTEEKALREKLRAHGKQLGDKREANRTQEIARLKQACAYEHWHRMLFARFLAENNLLIHPDYGEPISLDEVKEMAREQNTDWLSIAASFAQRMLLEVFRPDDPVLDLILPPETRQKLEEKLAVLPTEIFTAEDSLGWVYQFWQRDEKNAVNQSEVKIGADELAPVTQLFTEDYMVLFLLHNTLGAWWTAKRNALGDDPLLPDLEWKYLRLKGDGSPAAGTYSGWPKAARDLRLLDPCMGSGHFLSFALPILARMRAAEEGLSLADAVKAVLSDNLFGLELDARCSQIAAFNLAITAWRFVGRHFQLPAINVACSGLGINASKDSWIALAGENGLLRDTLAELYGTFQKAPALGSLIDPTRVGRPLLFAKFGEVWPLLEKALAQEQPNDESRELAIAARGVLEAARILAGKFTLVVTNVPYLGRYKQADDLKNYSTEYYEDAKADLATCFVDRCSRFCTASGTTALVSKDAPLFQPRYQRLRKRLLKTESWDFIARLGTGAFETISGEVVSVALIGMSREVPSAHNEFTIWDVSGAGGVAEKASQLRTVQGVTTLQSAQLQNPDAVITGGSLAGRSLLSDYANSYQGLSTADNPQFLLEFWTLPSVDSKWRWLQGAALRSGLIGGCSYILLWEDGKGRYYRHAMALKAEGRLGGWKSGKEAWGSLGVAVNVTSNLVANLYLGEMFDATIAAIIPKDPSNLLPILSYISSPEYGQELKLVDQALSVTELTFLKVAFDLPRWQQVATQNGSNCLPPLESDDPTQWLFNGHPVKSSNPLQVAVARLLGYQWPRQTGSSFPGCLEIGSDGLEAHAEPDGFVCLSSVAGEAPAADRLRALLATAYGDTWSAAKLSELLGRWNSLEEWLRDGFFEEHCSLFKGKEPRPFIWHVWDGRTDGFHALVNYHKLAAPNGEGRKTLEKLIYTALGDWIARQRSEVASGVDGADARMTAAQHLQSELEGILAGEEPYDIFVRWKPIHAQPIGWEPDLTDGVRPNIRPWLVAALAPHTKPKKGSCILRVTPKITYGKDRGKEPERDQKDFPWFADSTDRINDIHLSLEEKRAARERRKK